MTNFFFQYSHGHCGGGWLVILCNHHPAGMSVLGESHKACGFDLEARGLKQGHHKEEINHFFEDRVHFGDACVGIIKSFYPESVAHARQLAGREHVKLHSIVRNPMFKVLGAWRKKVPNGRKHYKHDNSDEDEDFRASLLWMRDNYYRSALDRVGRSTPLVRLEDLNRSMKYESGFFTRFVEWLTGTEWPDEYVRYCREHYTPAYKTDSWMEWEDNVARTGRVVRVHTKLLEPPQWPFRTWDDDPDPALRWVTHVNDRRREIYKEVYAEVEAELGYNVSAPGITEENWRHRSEWWGEVRG